MCLLLLLSMSKEVSIIQDYSNICLICHQNLFKFKNANRVTDYLVEDFQEMSLYKFLLTKKKTICIIEWNYS